MARRDKAFIERQQAFLQARTPENAHKRVKQEIRSCYLEYSPAQLVKAGEMMRAGRTCSTIRASKLDFLDNWEPIGVSRGGKKRGILYICRATSLAGAK